MAKFFTDWATWQKLVFILACAIVVTVALGGAKLGHTHWKLRKYVALAEKEKQEQALQRSMSQRQRTAEQQAADVPFGIRAIESGADVEGVWNSSRNNTPEPGSRDSSRASSGWDHVPRKDYRVDIEKQVEIIQLHDRSDSNSTTGTARPPSSGFDRAVSAERLPNSHASRDSSPDTPIAKPARTRHPPSSLTKFSGQPYLLRQDSATSTLHALEALYQASGPMNDHDEAMNDNFASNNSSNQSSNGTSDTEPIAASAPRLLNQQARPREKSYELDLMHHNRISQAAETGQLAPRVRKPGFSGEWASIATSGLPASSSEPGDYFGQQRQRSPSPGEGSSLMKISSNTSPTSPKIESLPPEIRRSSMPNVTPFTQFCQTAPPSPLPEGYRPVSADSNLTIRPRLDSHDSFVSAPSSPIKASPIELPAHVPPQNDADTKSQQPKRPSFEHRTSSVIRGHGTGFEILKPGTFNVSLPGEQSLDGPPVSLQNSSRPRSSSADSRRKLRKKRQPSGDEGPLTGRGSRASVI
ncbi:hypothetical protein M409DRAFT_27220 [Zasmidium cellare ATCC 36951]|uniref:Uncharacterized protein n=1 Tax=Zasmidium cellare ATCC 36951 TaxID=1080233 RepID=A0A6A6C5L9_ZASCE|nr:uncharacterized protein M409DRAFT_27220 [Zasmidium cellare ATCC 36951]KAF2162213.1 hypothetical protein M409DRAFT_27220 [Zasmidium cellare ATCC 36951]